MNGGPQTQETYSFRTGRAAGSLEDEFEKRLFDVSSQSELFGVLKDEKQAGPQTPYDTGHEFRSVSKRLICTPQVDLTVMSGPTKYRYVGCLAADPSYFGGGFTTIPAVNANYYGPRAIGAVAPTNPTADLAVTLAELKREGFPLVGSALFNHLQRGRSTPKRGKTPLDGGLYEDSFKGADAVAKENLAFQFGFQPIADEVRNLAKVAAGYREILAQYQRDSGRIVRRSFEFPLERSTTWEAPSYGAIAAASPTSAINSLAYVGGTRGGTTLRSTTTTRRTWFSGAFTYFLQDRGSIFDDAERISQQANILLGYRLTPEVLWNLAPWSWLSDWNVNIGQNIANASALASDGLVMQYGYLMSETTVEYTHVTSGPVLTNGQRGPWTTIYRTTRKERVKASPFGFSTVPGSFTARQWSILGSLGLTKSPGVLKGS